MKKKTNSKKKETRVMAFDLFERKYKGQIEMLTERILDEQPSLNEKNYDDVYDDCYEEAVFVLASEKHITLE